MSKKKTTEIIFSPNEGTQAESYLSLINGTSTEIYLTGSGGSGKTYLAIAWLVIRCLMFQGFVGLIGRAKLDDLKETTLMTMFQVFSDLSITQYNYNKQSNIISFPNGSSIILKQLGYEPSDPMYRSVSGLEISAAVLDEGDTIEERAKDIISSRIRKLKVKNAQGQEGLLVPKLVVTCNPNKGWIFNVYDAWRKNSLPPYKKFHHFLLSDNPKLPNYEAYKQQLERMNEIDKRRLLYADWDFEDQQGLIEYAAIQQIFTKEIPLEKGIMSLSCDVATSGKDKTIIAIWKDFTCIEIIEIAINTIPELVDRLRRISTKHNIPFHRMIIDAGAMAGVHSFLPSSIGFVSQARTLDSQNFENLRCQCYYQLARLINTGKLKIAAPISQKQKEMIIQELEHIRAKETEKDGKLKILSKPDIRKLISRSTDFSDALMMFAWFNVEGSHKITGEYFIRSASLKRQS